MGSAADYLAQIDARWHAGGALAEAGERHDEYADVRELLLDGAPEHDSDVVSLAECVARACLGDDHLWHDLGLPARSVLSDLLRTHFPRLAERNTGNMRWKKFFYLQLCEQVGIRACRAPSCGVCANYGECFGSEESPLAPRSPLQALARLAA
jgi:nitrogen fixation protein NifQ